MTVCLVQKKIREQKREGQALEVNGGTVGERVDQINGNVSTLLSFAKEKDFQRFNANCFMGNYYNCERAATAE